MTIERLRKEWREHQAIEELCDRPGLRHDGVILGAGTLLICKNDFGERSEPDQAVRRLKALLSAAYAQPIEDHSIKHVQAAAKCLGAGDASRASVHLALSRLGQLNEPANAAQRLFMADRLIQLGMTPESILKAMEPAGIGLHELGKYSPDQPRVPAGNGRASGEWTTAGGGVPNAIPQSNEPIAPAAVPRQATPEVGVGRPGLALANITFPLAPALPPSLDLGALSTAALGRLGIFLAGLSEVGALTTAVTVGGGVAALGVLFIPSSGPRGKWVEVGGPGDVSYYQNPDETAIRLKYTTPDGEQHLFVASPGPDGDYKGPDGRVIARLVKSGATAGIVVSTAALVGEGTDQPRACPAAVKDNGGERGRAYEDYAKALFNPGNPTPSGMAYAFWNPATGKWVKIDDCQQQTGGLGEYKGPGYEEHFLKKDGPWEGMWAGMQAQATNQEEARGGRSLTWFFEEKPVADFVRNQFEGVFPDIRVVWLKWPGKVR